MTDVEFLRILKNLEHEIHEYYLNNGLNFNVKLVFTPRECQDFPFSPSTSVVNITLNPYDYMKYGREAAAEMEVRNPWWRLTWAYPTRVYDVMDRQPRKNRVDVLDFLREVHRCKCPNCTDLSPDWYEGMTEFFEADGDDE